MVFSWALLLFDQCAFKEPAQGWNSYSATLIGVECWWRRKKRSQKNAKWQPATTWNVLSVAGGATVLPALHFPQKFTSQLLLNHKLTNRNSISLFFFSFKWAGSVNPFRSSKNFRNYFCTSLWKHVIDGQPFHSMNIM